LIWIVEFDDAATKELRKLDRQAQQEILRYFRKRIATDEDPRRFGKSLPRDLTGLWRTEKIFTINWHRKMGPDKRTAKRQWDTKNASRIRTYLCQETNQGISLGY